MLPDNSVWIANLFLKMKLIPKVGERFASQELQPWNPWTSSKLSDFCKSPLHEPRFKDRCNKCNNSAKKTIVPLHYDPITKRKTRLYYERYCVFCNHPKLSTIKNEANELWTLLWQNTIPIANPNVPNLSRKPLDREPRKSPVPEWKPKDRRSLAPKRFAGTRYSQKTNKNFQ